MHCLPADHRCGWPGPGDDAASGPGSGLGVMVMMVVVMMMVSRRSKHRACKHHQQQCGSKNLLHGTNLA